MDSLPIEIIALIDLQLSICERGRMRRINCRWHLPPVMTIDDRLIESIGYIYYFDLFVPGRCLLCKPSMEGTDNEFLEWITIGAVSGCSCKWEACPMISYLRCVDAVRYGRTQVKDVIDRSPLDKAWIHHFIHVIMPRDFFQ